MRMSLMGIGSWTYSPPITHPEANNDYVPSYETMANAIIMGLGQNKPGVPIPEVSADAAAIELYHKMMGSLQVNPNMPPPLTAAQRDAVELAIYNQQLSIVGKTVNAEDDSFARLAYYNALVQNGVQTISGAYADTAPGPGAYVPPSGQPTDPSTDAVSTSDYLTGPTGVLTAAPQTTSTVLNSILNQTAGTLGLDATQSSWLSDNKWLVLGGAAAIAWFLLKRK